MANRDAFHAFVKKNKLAHFFKMPKRKNLLRCAPAPFKDVLHLVSYSYGGMSTPAFGHLLKYCDSGAGSILPEEGGPVVEVPSGSWHTVLQNVPDIPSGAFPLATEPLEIVADHEVYPDIDFLEFSSKLPFLFVRKPGGVTTRLDGEEWSEGTAASIAALCTDGCEMPWTWFLDGTAADTSIWRIKLTSVTDVPACAARLVQEGCIVSCCGSDTQKFICVKSLHLKWTTDDACAAAMSTINDTMPGLTLGEEVYTTDFQVHRCMLHWSMLAGCRTHAPDNANITTEPLKSYIEALSAVKSHRKVMGRVDDFTRAAEVLKYNTAARLTPAQFKQALTIFYWASLVPQSEAERQVFRRALNMYLHFGFVILRKRSYEFRGNGKKKRAYSKPLI